MKCTTTARTVLLTGASGVVGRALLPELAGLAGHRVICLTHRRSPGEGYETVRGDLRQPGLGLRGAEYRQLAHRVDAVVHCAAVTGFTEGAQATQELNVRGTEGVAGFAADAGATLYYVSTAFVDRTDVSRYLPPHSNTNPVHYLDSKRTAEQVVRAGAPNAVIVRPSVVIGDSRTGEIAQFQGLHQVASGVVRNLLPLVPMAPDATIDFIPQDVVARAIAALVGARVTEGEYWLTAGADALDAATVFGTFAETGRRAGLDVTNPRLVHPEMVERLIRPAFVDTLPASTRSRFDELAAMTALFAGSRPFPSSLAAVPGMAALRPAELLDALVTSVAYLVRAKGLATPERSPA